MDTRNVDTAARAPSHIVSATYGAIPITTINRRRVRTPIASWATGPAKADDGVAVNGIGLKAHGAEARAPRQAPATAAEHPRPPTLGIHRGRQHALVDELRILVAEGATWAFDG